MVQRERSDDIFLASPLIEHSSFLPFLRMNPDTLPVLVPGPLKLAKKYQSGVLENRLITHFKESYPTTLKAWDEVAYPSPAKPGSKPPDKSSHVDPSSYLTKDFLSDPVSLVTLARECDLPVIFAALLYSLCRYSPTRKRQLSHMTREDLETLFLGKVRMIRFISGPAADQLGIESWNNQCMDKRC